MRARELYSHALNGALDQGNKNLCLLREANTGYGCLIFDEFALLLTACTLSSYVALSVVTDIAQSSQTLGGIFLLSSETLIASSLLYFALICGEAVKEKTANVVKALRSLSLHASRTLSDVAMIDLTKYQFKAFEGIKPLKLVDLDVTVTMSALSAVLTNLIVLLQFKAGESPL